jgi:hypothetical protein
VRAGVVLVRVRVREGGMGLRMRIVMGMMVSGKRGHGRRRRRHPRGERVAKRNVERQDDCVEPSRAASLVERREWSRGRRGE